MSDIRNTGAAPNNITNNNGSLICKAINIPSNLIVLFSHFRIQPKLQ